MIDYRSLLKKYMGHVDECEAFTFLDAPGVEKRFSAEEMAELRDIESELADEGGK